MTKLAAALILGIALAALGGCALGNRVDMHYTRSVTLGQELMDLMAAKEKGALTDKEYATLKEKALKGEQPFAGPMPAGK